MRRPPHQGPTTTASPRTRDRAMTSTTMHRRAHLETVIEFELDPDPVQAASRDLGGRASHLRRLLAVTGVTIGLATAASIGAGIATASSPAHPPAASTASPHEP